MSEPGDQQAMQSEAMEIVRGLLEKQAGRVDEFVATLGSSSVRQLSQLLSSPAQQESGDDAGSDAELSPEVRAAISKAITQEVEPMIDRTLDELELDLDEDELDEELINDIISQLIDIYLNEVRSALGL